MLSKVKWAVKPDPEAFCTGISVKPHAKGMTVTALKQGTSAADSGLEVNDIITVVDIGDEQFFLAGLPWYEACEKLSGPRSEPTFTRAKHIEIVKSLLTDMPVDLRYRKLLCFVSKCSTSV